MEGAVNDGSVRPPGSLWPGVRLLSCHEVAWGESDFVLQGVLENRVPVVFDTCLCSTKTNATVAATSVAQVFPARVDVTANGTPAASRDVLFVVPPIAL